MKKTLETDTMVVGRKLVHKGSCYLYPKEQGRIEFKVKATIKQGEKIKEGDVVEYEEFAINLGFFLRKE
jgi:hypothetical protein